MTIYDASVFKQMLLWNEIMHANTHYKNTYREKLLGKIESLNTSVFTRDDLTRSHSNQAQLRLNRALKTFIDQGHIVKVSHGLYAKAEPITLPNGKNKIILRDSFESVAIAALNKLGLHWEYGSAIAAYNRGETTQVPAAFSVKLHSRFRGTIAAEGRKVIFEDGINAR